MCLLDYLINSDLSIYHIFAITEQTKQHTCPLVVFVLVMLYLRHSDDARFARSDVFALQK